MTDVDDEDIDSMLAGCGWNNAPSDPPAPGSPTHGYEAPPLDSRKNMWSDIQSRSQASHAQPEQHHKVWSDNSSAGASENFSTNSSAFVTKGRLRGALPEPVGEILRPPLESETLACPTILGECTVEPLEHGLEHREEIRKDLENEVQSPRSDVQPQESDIQQCKNDIVPQGEEAATAAIKKKKGRREGARQRPHKAQRGYATKLAIMLLEAGTDEDREEAEMVFMQATENEPLLYDYAMLVLQRLRLEGKNAVMAEVGLPSISTTASEAAPERCSL